MEIKDVKAKIQKLFTMADPANGASESEIKSAITMARKLMFKYKIADSDLEEHTKAEIITKVFSDITFSTLKNPWINNLTRIIGNNYCCHGVMSSTYGAKTKNAAFIGYSNDVDVAENVLRYAVNSVFTEHKHIASKMRKQGYSFHDITSASNAYGNGFVRGIKEAFEKQNIEESSTTSESDGSKSFAMVMVEPQAVVDYVNHNCGTAKFNTSAATHNARSFDSYAVEGYKRGKEFNMRSRIAG